MYKTWRLQGPGESCLIAPRSRMVQEEQLAYLSTQLDRWLADPSSCKVLMEMYESLHAGAAQLARRLQPAQVQRSVKVELLDAFRRGELVVLREPHVSVFPTITMPARAASGAPVDAPPPAAQQPAAVADTTWAEIELVDQDGEAVPNVRYQVELADGTTRGGTLDGQGRALLKDLEPGTLKVTFPDFDGAEWDTAG